MPAAAPASLEPQVQSLPLLSLTPLSWARFVLETPLELLGDHAFLEKKAANNAMELLTRWPSDWVPGWVETMAAIARDETAHLSQVVRLLLRRGGRLPRVHQNPYANALRLLVRKGDSGEIFDRLCISALIEARSCERFGVLSAAAADLELAAFYRALFNSELGHYKVFLKLAFRVLRPEVASVRWHQLLAAEADILAIQSPGPRIHSGAL